MLKVVHVTWKDPAFSNSGWMDRDEFEKWAKSDLPDSDSVGMLAHEAEEYIVLVQSVGKVEVADSVKISRSAISEIREIGEVPITLEFDK